MEYNYILPFTSPQLLTCNMGTLPCNFRAKCSKFGELKLEVPLLACQTPMVLDITRDQIVFETSQELQRLSHATLY